MAEKKTETKPAADAPAKDLNSDAAKAPAAHALPKPSQGRVLLHCTGSEEGQTSPAIITKVNEDGTVSLTVFREGGQTAHQNKVRIVDKPTLGCAIWPPKV